MWRKGTNIGLFGKQVTASLAQLEERGSHNPKVVSSILTTRIFPFLDTIVFWGKLV